MDYQKLVIVGNVTRDAERKTSKKGDVNFTTFSVAVSDGKDRTTFFSVTLFGKIGETLAEYITKGRQILVEGRITVNDNGRFNVVADHVELGASPKRNNRPAEDETENQSDPE